MMRWLEAERKALIHIEILWELVMFDQAVPTIITPLAL